MISIAVNVRQALFFFSENLFYAKSAHLKSVKNVPTPLAVNIVFA